jgi:hypothetical protein
MRLAAAALLLSSAASVRAQQSTNAGAMQLLDLVREDDAQRELPVLKSNTALATVGGTVSLARLSAAGVAVVLDKSHCA